MIIPTPSARRTVNAYKLITPGTVEEKIFDLQMRKAQTIADVLGEEGFARNLTKAELEYLFAEDCIPGSAACREVTRLLRFWLPRVLLATSRREPV